MSDVFYSVIRHLFSVPFRMSGRPVVLGREHVPRAGPFILASNHQSPYDVPFLIMHTPRRVDFVSIVEVFQKPIVGKFYGAMNAFPLDRGKPDAKTVRIILDRLERGRVVGMFPEGRFRTGASSMVHTKQIKPGIGRLAQLANVPIVPCAIIGSPSYSKVTSWSPLRRTRYGLAFGKPIVPRLDPERIEANLIDAIATLHDTLVAALHFGIDAG